MSKNGLAPLLFGSLLIVTLGVACSDDAGDDNDTTGGSSAEGGSAAGTAPRAGSSNAQAGNGGSGGKASPVGGAGGEPTVAGGADPVGGAGSPTTNEGGAGGVESPGGEGGEANGGEGGNAGAPTSSCETVRATLLGPIASVSTGQVTVSGEQDGIVSLVVDASAGGFMAAANNPYIYVNLATKARVDITDPQADASTAWDLAFKRDNIRSNGGDSGPGNAQVASLLAADFGTITATDAVGADFALDAFIDQVNCDPIVDAVGKPLTVFDGWYDYDLSTMTLTPADRVYLVRGADGTSLYKLRITGYYVDVSDGMGGTVKKSAVFSLDYQAL